MRRISQRKDSTGSLRIYKIIKRHIFLIILLVVPLILQISLIPQITNRSDISKQFPKESWVDFYSYAYEWDHTWLKPNIEFCYDMAIDDSDNIYLVGGTSVTGGSYNQVIVKFDKFGNEIWNYKGESGIIDEIDLDSSGDIFIINGTTLKKFTSNGALNWTKYYPTDLKSIYIDDSDDIYLSGDGGDYFVMKCNSTGDIMWNGSWSGMGTSQIKTDESGNVYLAGTTNVYGAGDYDACLVKFNGTGSYQWHKTFGGPDRDWGNTLAVDLNGSVFIAGSIELNWESDMFYAKFDENGVKEYHNIIGFYGKDETCRTILLNEMYDEYNDNFYLCGEYINSWKDRNMAIYSERASHDYSGPFFDIWDGEDSYHPYSSAFDSLNNIIMAGWSRSITTGNYDMCFARFGKDSDMEGLSDYQEINLYNTNPDKDDTDNDGLTDYEEVKIYNTNPNNPDTDGDGSNDEYEILNGFDPNDPFSNRAFGIMVVTFSVIGALIGISVILIISHYYITKKKSRS